MSRIADILKGLEKDRERSSSFSVDLNQLDSYISKPAEKIETKLIPVASGKGGVGKTNLSVNMGIALARQLEQESKRVLIVDCDFGLPDADLILGMRETNQLETFLRKSGSSLNELKVPTRFENLFFLGNSDRTSSILSNMYYAQRKKFLKGIRSLNCDVVILDLGASAHYEVIDFFSAVDSGIIVANPEPPSLRDAKLFLRNVVVRRTKQWLQYHKLESKYIERWETAHKITTSLLDEVKQGLPEQLLPEVIGLFSEIRPRLIVSKSTSEEDSWRHAKALRDEIKHEIGIDMHYIGCISDDPLVKEAILSKAPVLERFPTAPASKNILTIAEAVWKEKDFNLDRNYYALKQFLRGLFRR